MSEEPDPDQKGIALNRRGIIFVISAPSGAGKTTILNRISQSQTNIVNIVSVTTRPQRKGEKNGVDYHFVTDNEFDKLIGNSSLLQYATILGSRYGTPNTPVAQALSKGHDVVLNVDWQGKTKICRRYKHDAVSIFVLPPSFDDLSARLYARARESNEEIKERLALAGSEVGKAKTYDYVVVNTELDKAVVSVRCIIHAERLRRSRYLNMDALLGDPRLRM